MISRSKLVVDLEWWFGGGGRERRQLAATVGAVPVPGVLLARCTAIHTPEEGMSKHS